MGKLNASQFLANTKLEISRHSPEILTGLGIVGMLTTTFLAAKATPKAMLLIEARSAELQLEHDEKLPPMETIKATWKCYIPAAISGVSSIACLLGANSVNVRRNAALATAYKLSETALIEYKDKVAEIIGEKKEKLVRDKIAEDKLKKDPVSKREIIITDKGNTLCYDSLSGRYFHTDINAIKAAKNVINDRLIREMYISLNEFYDEIELAHTSIGDELGWNLDNGLIDIEFSYAPAEDDTPCLVLNYSVAPRYNYYKFT